jgi:hypothetical protein
MHLTATGNDFQGEVAALCPPRGYPRLRQHNTSAYLVWSWYVTLSSS